MTRSGPSTLVALARDYGVDYGDVLLVADVHRYTLRYEPLPQERARAAVQALARIGVALGRSATTRLEYWIADHAMRTLHDAV